jgi:hypothetical protein
MQVPAYWPSELGVHAEEYSDVVVEVKNTIFISDMSIFAPFDISLMPVAECIIDAIVEDTMSLWLIDIIFMLWCIRFPVTVVTESGLYLTGRGPYNNNQENK